MVYVMVTAQFYQWKRRRRFHRGPDREWSANTSGTRWNVPRWDKDMFTVLRVWLADKHEEHLSVSSMITLQITSQATFFIFHWNKQILLDCLWSLWSFTLCGTCFQSVMEPSILNVRGDTVKNVGCSSFVFKCLGFFFFIVIVKYFLSLLIIIKLILRYQNQMFLIINLYKDLFCIVSSWRDTMKNMYHN